MLQNLFLSFFTGVSYARARKRLVDEHTFMRHSKKKSHLEDLKYLHLKEQIAKVLLTK